MAYVIREFAKEVIQSRKLGAPPLDLDHLKTRIHLFGGNPDDLQPLLFAAIEMVYVELVRFLIEEQHVDPNHLYTEHYEMVDDNVKVRFGMNPISVLHVVITTTYSASKERLTEMFLYLVDKVNSETIKSRIVTNNPANNNGTILHYLSSRAAFSRFDTIPIVRQLFEKAPDLINMQSDARQTALHVAALTGNVDMVNELIRRDANVTLKDRDGHTPRDLAVSDEIRVLLDSALEPVAPPGSPPRGLGAAGAGSPPVPASPASPPYIGSPSDPQAGGRRRTRRKRSKRKKTRGRRRA